MQVRGGSSVDSRSSACAVWCGCWASQHLMPRAAAALQAAGRFCQRFNTLPTHCTGACLACLEPPVTPRVADALQAAGRLRQRCSTPPTHRVDASLEASQKPLLP